MPGEDMAGSNLAPLRGSGTYDATHMTYPTQVSFSISSCQTKNPSLPNSSLICSAYSSLDAELEPHSWSSPLVMLKASA